MRFRFLTPLFFLFVSAGSMAQYGQFLRSPSDTSKHYLSVDMGFESNANSLTNKMIQSLLWGGHMDNTFLTEQRDKLNALNNHLGYEFRSSITYSWKQRAHEWQVGLKYRDLFGFNYTRDFFGLVFLGNYAYEGQIADLTNSNYAYWRYAGLQAGWSKWLNEGKGGKLYVGLSAVYSPNYQQLTSNSASLYTAPDAEYLKLQGDFTLQYKDQQNGYGAGLDLGYSVEFGENLLLIQVQDLGFMQFSGVTQYRGDSTYEYRGEDAGNIGSFNGDSLFSNISTGGFVSKFGIEQKQVSVTQMLPFSVNLVYLRKLNEKWNASLQGYYTKMPAYVPRATARIERLFQNNWKANLGLAYGGFGRENVLLGAQKTWASNWTLHMEGYFLGLLVLPNNSHGFGLTFGVKKSF